jgi:hypothetical protein
MVLVSHINESPYTHCWKVCAIASQLNGLRHPTTRKTMTKWKYHSLEGKLMFMLINSLEGKLESVFFN